MKISVFFGLILAVTLNIIPRQVQLMNEIEVTELRTLAAPSTISQARWSHDLSKLAILTFETMEIWNTETWQLEHRINEVYASEFAWHPTENRIAVITRRNVETLLIWSAETGELQTEISRDIPGDRSYTNSYTALSWSPDGTRIASGSWVDTITIWNLDSETVTSLVPLRINAAGGTGAISEMWWSPSGDRLLTGSATDRIIQVWDSFSGDNLLTVSGYRFVAWSPDESQFAGASFDLIGDSYDFSRGNYIGIWDSSTGELETQFTHHSNTITSVDWNPNGDIIASTDVDGNLYLWSAETTMILFHRSSFFLGARHANWRPDGLQLAVVGIDVITIYDIKQSTF